MGMRYEDFWYNYDLGELWNAFDGYAEAESRRAKESWEQTRLICTEIRNKPVFGFKIRPTTPEKLLPFTWDNEGGSVPGKDELEQLRKETWGHVQ